MQKCYIQLENKSWVKLENKKVEGFLDPDGESKRIHLNNYKEQWLKIL